MGDSDSSMSGVDSPSVLDEIASRVYGALKGKDCRCVWADGWLYVVRAVTDIVAVECEMPKRAGGTFKTLVDGQALTFLRPGCGSCRRRVQASPIGQMSVDDIVARGRAMIDA